MDISFRYIVLGYKPGTIKKYTQTFEYVSITFSDISQALSCANNFASDNQKKLSELFTRKTPKDPSYITKKGIEAKYEGKILSDILVDGDFFSALMNVRVIQAFKFTSNVSEDEEDEVFLENHLYNIFVGDGDIKRRLISDPIKLEELADISFGNMDSIISSLGLREMEQELWEDEIPDSPILERDLGGFISSDSILDL